MNDESPGKAAERPKRKNKEKGGKEGPSPLFSPLAFPILYLVLSHPGSDRSRDTENQLLTTR